MSEGTRLIEAGHRYALAYLSHYAMKDLYEALGLYQDIVTRYGDTPEAAYSQSQIMNIVNSIVPQQEILDTQVDLAMSHIRGRAESSDSAITPNGSSNSDKRSRRTFALVVE